MMNTSCFNLWSAILSAIHLYSSVLFALWLSRQDSKCSINFFTITIVTKIQPIKFLSIQLSDNSRSLSKYSILSPRSDKNSNFRQNSVYLQMLDSVTQINLVTSSLNHLIAGLVYFRSRISSPLARTSDLVTQINFVPLFRRE